MSLVSIQSILETKLAEISPSITTIHIGEDYSPISETPYQRVDILWAKPDNVYLSRNYDQSGYMQVSLFYPLSEGSAAILTQTDRIKDKFKSGSIITGVHIMATPEVGQVSSEEDRLFVAVKVEFSKFITEV